MPSNRSTSRTRLSVVAPVFDESVVLPELRRRLCEVLSAHGIAFEVVLVDDGSTDGSGEVLDRFCDEDPRFRCVHLSRNFGHQAAVTAGLDHASGDVVCVMDADLQDPPEVIPSLLAEWEKGNDVVYAIRRDRKEGRLQVALYRLFYRLLAHLSTVPMPLDAGDFCLVSREVLDEMRRLPEKERFVRGLRSWVGFRQVGVSYERHERGAGRSKYNFFGLLRLAVNGIVSFSDKPLVYLTAFGLLTSATAFVYALYLVLYKVVGGGVVTGYSSLMAGLLFFGGVQLVALGVLGLYISKIFLEVKGRPSYIVRSVRGQDTPDGEAIGSGESPQ